MKFLDVNIINQRCKEFDSVPKTIYFSLKVYRRNTIWEPRSSLWDMWERSQPCFKNSLTCVEPLAIFRVTPQFNSNIIPAYLNSIDEFMLGLAPQVAFAIKCNLLVVRLQCFPILINSLSPSQSDQWESLLNKNLSVAIVIEEDIIDLVDIERIKRSGMINPVTEYCLGSNLHNHWITQFFRKAEGGYRLYFPHTYCDFKSARTVFL